MTYDEKWQTVKPSIRKRLAERKKICAKSNGAASYQTIDKNATAATENNNPLRQERSSSLSLLAQFLSSPSVVPIGSWIEPNGGGSTAKDSGKKYTAYHAPLLKGASYHKFKEYYERRGDTRIHYIGPSHMRFHFDYMANRINGEWIFL
jgi:hypothetical protein